MYQNRQDNDFSRHIPPPIGETFDPVAWEPGRQPGPSPNPSVTPITGSPCSTRVITVSSSASSSLETPSFPFFPFSLSKESEPNRGASITRKDRRGTTRTRPDRTRRLSYPPCTAAVFHWCVIAWRKPWLQPAAGAPCITSPIRAERRRAFRRRALWSSDIIKGRAKPVGNGRNGTTWRAWSPRGEEKARDGPRDRCCCHHAS